MHDMATPHSPYVRPRSSLAMLQQVIVLSTWFVAITAVLWWWPKSPLAAMAWGAGVLMGYCGLLGVQFLLAAWQHGHDPAPRAGGLSLLRAWWQETWAAAAVFAWRQPFAWKALPDTWSALERGSREPSAANAHPVVFIHGFVCNRGFWYPWMRALRARGIPYVSLNLEPVMGGIDGFVAQLEAAVSCVGAAQGATCVKPVLICHSMGGLVARAWLASNADNGGRVHRVITIGTPHHGTWLARWGHAASGHQMRIGSAWLAALQQREALSPGYPTSITCWYSNTDNIVFPPSTATLAGADNRMVPGTGHVALAFHPTVMRESLAMLASGESSPMRRTES